MLQQSTAAAPYLGWGVFPHRCPSWPLKWDGSSRSSCAQAATAPWKWGYSSQLPSLALGTGWLLPATTPGLGCRPWPRTRGNSSPPRLLHWPGRSCLCLVRRLVKSPQTLKLVIGKTLVGNELMLCSVTLNSFNISHIVLDIYRRVNIL